MRASARAAVPLFLLAGSACGFHLVGKGSNLPPHIRTVAVPVFRNETAREELEQRFTIRLLDEIARRGGLRTTPEEAGADAVLSGSVLRYDPRPTQFDEDGRATVIEIVVIASVKFEDRREGKVLWENGNFLFRGEYPVTGDPETYFDKEGFAIEDVARDFSRSVVSTIFEGF